MKHAVLAFALVMLVSCGEDRPHYEDTDVPQDPSATDQLDVITGEIRPDTSAPGTTQATTSFNDFQTGDLIFQVAETPVSEFYQKMTGDNYTHCGMIKVTPDGQLVVIEAGASVTRSPLDIWISRGAGYHYVVRRYDGMVELTTDSTLIMNAAALGKQLMGKRNDEYYNWHNDEYYASELVYRLFADGWGVQLTEPTTLGQMNLSDADVQLKLAEYYGANFPLDEPVVTIGQLMDTEVLTTVFSN